jgi:hypothetical protein
MLDAAQVALRTQGGSHVGFASDELNLVAPGTRRAHGSSDWSQWCVVAAHGIQRDANHQVSGIIHERVMGLLDEVRANAAALAASAKHVQIQHAAIEAYAHALPTDQARQPELDPATHFTGAADDTLAYVVALDAINFGSGYFPLLKKRHGLSGYFTVASSLKDAWPLTSADLVAVTAHECARMFGQEPIEDQAIAELMALFAQALTQLGRFVQADFGGDFRTLVDAADGSAEQLARLLARMPFYQDVGFYKRAQLTAADLSTAGVARFADLDQLTIFADNLVPHVLRLDGILSFEPDLVERIEREELIPRGSPQEREIRACALHAVELIAAALERRVTPMQLDYVLWNRGQGPSYKARPRHRTRTVFY